MTGNNQFVSHDILYGLLGPQSVQVERRKLTKGEWDTVCNQISSLLYRLSTAHDDGYTSASSCVLRILEYLIRRYDVHATKETAHLLLLTSLPHHESKFFTRILQLVDLHSLPLWNWLRPYAANGAPPLPRSAVAARASKDDALLVQLLQLAKDMATISTSGFNASRIISFVGATVSEALARQATTTTSGSNNPSGTRMVSEQTVRHILPYLLSACGGEPDEISSKHPSQVHHILFLSCPEWRNLGYILTTVLSDYCILGYAAREVIAVTMAKGSLLLDNALRQKDDCDEEEALEAATDSLLAISAFLIPNSTTTFLSDHSDHDNFVGIHLLNTSTSHHKVTMKKNSTKPTTDTTTTIIGCELPKSTYLALCRHRLLGRAFSNATEGRNIDITSLLAAFIKRAISYLSDEKDGKRLGSQIIELLVRIIYVQITSLSSLTVFPQTYLYTFCTSFQATEEGLRRVWQTGKQHVFAASVASEIIQLFAKSTSKLNVEYYKSSLVSIHQVSRLGCDLGVATTVSLWDANDTKGKAQMRQLLRESFGSKDIVQEDNEAAIDSKEKMGSAPTELIDFVPPRIALEHPDSSVRKKAIKKLMLRFQQANQPEEDNDRIASALLRRAAVDDDVEVAADALTAFLFLAKEDLTTYVPSVEDAISVTRQWSLLWRVPKQKKLGIRQRNDEKSSSQRSMTKHEMSIACGAVELCSMAASDTLSKSDLQTLIQCIALHSEIDELKEEFDTAMYYTPSELKEKLQKSIRDALVDVLKSKTGEELPSESSITNVLLSSSTCLGILRNDVVCRSKEANHPSVEEKFIEDVQNRFIRVMVSSFNTSIADRSINLTSCSDIQSALLYMANNKKKCDDESLLRCMKKYISSSLFSNGISQLSSEYAIQLVEGLASVGSVATFEHLSVPAIKEVCLVYCSACSDTTPNLLLEVCTMPSATKESTVRLVQLARETLPSLSFHSGEIALLLSLVSHSIRTVRQGVSEIFSEVARTRVYEDEVLFLSKIASNMKSKLELGGENALVDLLKECIIKSSTSFNICTYLLKQCELCTVGENGTRLKSCGKSMYVGCFTAASILLNAMEDAGDSFFPLEERWKSCGKIIYDTLSGVDSGDTNDMQDQPLANSVVRMLKGVVVRDEKPINLVTGPSGRSRSYSVGNSDELTWLSQYPVSMWNSMIDCFTHCLSFRKMSYVARATIRLVLSRPSWSSHIFINLPDKPRRQIVLSLMQLKEVLDDNDAAFALFDLPLRADDFISLLQTIEDTPSSSQSKLISITQLSECIARRAHHIEKVKVRDLARILFKLLNTLSFESHMHGDELDVGLGFTRFSLLQALIHLFRGYKVGQKDTSPTSGSGRVRARSRSSSFSCYEKEPSFPELAPFTELLVGLLGAATSLKGAQGIRPLQSTQSKSIVVALLSILCASHSESCTRYLSEALINLVASCSEKDVTNDYLDLVTSVMKTIVQLGHSSTFSAVSLYRSLAITCISSSLTPSLKGRLYQSFADPLIGLNEDLHSGKSVASLLAVTLAMSAFSIASCNNEEHGVGKKHESDVFVSGKDSLMVNFCLHTLKKLSSSRQLYATLELLTYAGNLADILKRPQILSSQEGFHEESSGNRSILYVPCTELLSVALGSVDGRVVSEGEEYSFSETRSIMLLSTAMLTIVRDVLSYPAVKKVIRSSEEGSKLCLSVWKELIQLQVASRWSNRNRYTSEKQFWKVTPDVIRNCLATLQKMLPIPYFLASVLALLAEEDADAATRKYALTLLAERSAEVDPKSTEFLLFLEAIPELVDLCKKNVASVREEAHGNKKEVVLLQSALKAIEGLVKSLFPSGRKLSLSKMETNILLETLGSTSEISMNSAQNFSVAFPDRKWCAENGCIFSSSISCSTTLLSLLQYRALPQLKSLLNVLLQSMQSINTFKKMHVEDMKENSRGSKDFFEVLDLIHCSVVTGLTASLEALPQFFNPYLVDLLQPDAVPSLLQSGVFQTEALMRSVERLHQSLGTKIPARHLLPAIHVSITKQVRSNESMTWKEIRSVTQVMSVCLKATKRTDLATVMSKALGSLMMTYAYAAEQDERYPLLETCNEALLALVLIISESELHTLYAKMREWRGELDFENFSAISSSKRYAFWIITAALAKELRSLFLPCLSTVLMDVVSELVSLIW